MFQRIIKFSIENKLVVGVFTCALVAWGLWSLLHLPFDATPDITNNQVQIIVTSQSTGAEEMERNVTTPIEMALANIPEVKERRSISRSGMAVITMVFDDATDNYWARELIDQQLGGVKEKLPDDVDVELAPISTGLGEIYHYTIRAEKGYEDKYSLTDLRTIQDWIVRKQLSGTPGIAEVSGWGGYVKQYEVDINLERLNAMGVTIAELYTALNENNENTGGGYIERLSNQYYIRGIGLVKSLEDIERIVVKTQGGVPVLVGDVAHVHFGHATRYGAVTRNGEGEVVAGITLMLRGENFQEVIKNVKSRIADIQKSLPKGVVIEPFIDRTLLVDRVTNTIARNLMEGGLIVIFILILFLGNYRAGLVVASVIPLSMLFAFGMMRMFGVSGNLMSLGAIDFGMIVDGAIIIVEAVVARIASQNDTRIRNFDNLVYESSSRIRKSAAFGEIIIMIVYLPMMTLVGIEGKMFRPMAMTIFFAILGAFILSLTYVPMMSAVCLKRKTTNKVMLRLEHATTSLSARMMARLQSWYLPLVDKCMNHGKVVIVGMVAFFGASLLLMSRLGAEFVPTLEEGDFAVELSMAQGTSLTQMVETCTKAEQILKQQFPEIKQVVTRIGSAEIPTDPMPVERADMLVALKPKAEWTSAEAKNDLQEKMEEALGVIPGLDVEMSQPIQMRNNELITGIRQDVAVKIYGGDTEVLADLADKVEHLIKDVDGVGSLFLEKVNGLPQLQVEYNRQMLAKYGISIRQANDVLQSAFAGKIAGSVTEENRQFDIVLRIHNDGRDALSNFENLFVPSPSGVSVPMRQLATISYKEAPAQISHEDGERSIFVGFNVKGRDVSSTMGDIQQILDDRLEMPVGYHYAFGGEFENLQSATDRLMVAIPVALVLILLLLYATLKSVRETLFVASAIPLSAIGGIVALWLRGMPMSISAGIGFIALFGVAVLNGIVLVGQFNALERQGIADIRRRILEGCEHRLRPVIMTALVASFGFLPMALSTSDGAEVQRPLATVVIGGLLTATILTLFVIPTIYKTFTKKTEANSHQTENEKNI
ncbi:MAG: efflux RND transporter permease subunit [Prevotella sp.]|nr:efflux RND transporter permease subunit [Prevotella sp.]